MTYAIPVQGQTLDIKMTAWSTRTPCRAPSSSAAWAGRPGPPSASRRRGRHARLPAGAAARRGRLGGSLTDVTGKWNMRGHDGRQPVAAHRHAEAGRRAVSGARSTAPLGEMPVTGTMIGTQLKLQFRAQTPQGDMAVTMTGELGPDGLSRQVARGQASAKSDWVGKQRSSNGACRSQPVACSVAVVLLALLALVARAAGAERRHQAGDRRAGRLGLGQEPQADGGRVEAGDRRPRRGHGVQRRLAGRRGDACCARCASTRCRRRRSRSSASAPSIRRSTSSTCRSSSTRTTS